MSAASLPVVPGLERPEAIGRGGFGVVYAADEPAFGRRVAVKVLTARIGDDEARRGFERECRAMGALSGHPHIVAVHRGGTTARGEPYIVMEFMAGGSLGDRMARTGPLPWSEVLEIGILVAGALETAHRAGILHLDVKPANVLMSRFAEPALGDFGISRIPGVTVTLDGRVRATATYSAPERLMAGAATVAADLYGLGATLFALLTGGPAFAGEPGEEMLVTVARILRDPVPDLRTRGVPAALAETVERLMAKEPGDRPTSAAETALLLQAAQRAAGQSVTRPVIEGERTTHLPIAVPASDAAASTSATTAVNARSSDVPASWPPVDPPSAGPGRERAADAPPPSDGARRGAAQERPPWAAATVGRPPPEALPWLPGDAANGGGRPVESAHRPPASPADRPPWASDAGQWAGPARPGSPTRGDPAPPWPLPPLPSPPSPRRRGPLIGGVAVALVAVIGVVTTFVLLGRGSAPAPSAPTPTGGVSTPAPTTARVTTAVAVAPGITHPATADVARVLDAYITGINERRYRDAFALFSQDNPTAKRGLQSWIAAESTTRIRDARLLSVSDGPGGSVNAEMTFTSTQDAALGFAGQTCSRWDLIYDMVGPGPGWRIHLVSTRRDPTAC